MNLLEPIVSTAFSIIPCLPFTFQVVQLVI